jgi:hypothetical protein
MHTIDDGMVRGSSSKRCGIATVVEVAKEGLLDTVVQSRQTDMIVDTCLELANPGSPKVRSMHSRQRAK